jgi:hypothetical protein
MEILGSSVHRPRDLPSERLGKKGNSQGMRVVRT